MDIVIDRLPRADGVELSVRGRLDAECAGELRLAVAAETRRGVHAITLDLDGVSFLSSAGIRVLFETQREARQAGGDCRITTASPPVRKVLELTRLDRILMQPADAATAAPPTAAARRDLEAAGVRLVGFEHPPAGTLPGRRHGDAAALRAAGRPGGRVRLPPHAFAIGIAAVGEDGPADRTAGEMLAAAGAVFHRPPRPFAAIDYLIGSGDLVAEADLVTGLSWEGFPGGRAGFEPVGDAAAVAIDDLAAALLGACGPGPLAVVVAGEVHGLVAAELIRPLAEATPTDHPLAGTSETAATWLCFSREPVHAGRTAVVVGVIGRDEGEPLGPSGARGHLHAAVFPHRPLKRAAADLAAVVADLAASEPLAVVHLMADERPVLGAGRSGLVRGACWFAPLAFREGDA